jgi:hypothetical protein
MSPNEKSNVGYVTNVYGKEEVLQLLGEMLSQVKPGYSHHQPHLSTAARAAIAAHRKNLETLGTEIRTTTTTNLFRGK